MPTIDVQVGTGADDGWVRNGSFDNSGSVVYIGSTNSLPYHSFYRLTGITIPQGSTIDVCYISVYEQNSNANALTKLYLEKAPDPAAVSSYADYLARTLTSAGIDWNGDPGDAGWHDSPSLVIPMQELVDAYGLDNAAVQVMHKDDGSLNVTQVFRTYDYNTTRGVKLHIEYTAGGATAKTSAETGAGAEALLLQAAITRGETAGGVDARQSLVAALVQNESGAGTEQSLLTSGEAKFSADTGSGMETRGLLAALARVDGGWGTDAGWLAGLKSILSNDLGGGSDALKALIVTSGMGSDMKLTGRQAHVRIPSKGVSL